MFVICLTLWTNEMRRLHYKHVVAVALLSAAVLCVVHFCRWYKARSIEAERYSHVITRVESRAGGEVEVTEVFEWYDNAVGIARQTSPPFWFHEEIVSGPGTHFTVDHTERSPGSRRAGWYYVLNIQLPPNFQVGDVIEVSPMSSRRAQITRKNGKRQSEMLPGEMTAFQFGNPHLVESISNSNANSCGTIQIISVSPNDVMARLQLAVPFTRPGPLTINKDVTFYRVKNK